MAWDGSILGVCNRRLGVVKCYLNVPGPSRLLMVCDYVWAGMGTWASP